MSQLKVTITPVDPSGNALTGLDLRLRKTGSLHGDSGSDYLVTVISLTETPASSGKYISPNIADTVDITSPDNSSLGNYEVWKYVSGFPDSLLVDNYSIGTSVGVINQLSTMQTDIDSRSLLTHNHDTVYYIQTTVDGLLAAKSDSSHVHDSRYYLQSVVDSTLLNYSLTGHVHDDRYYTETELDNQLKYDTNLPIPHSFSSGVPIAFDDSTGASDVSLLSIPVKQGLLKKSVLVPFTFDDEMTGANGTVGGTILDVANDIYTDSAAVTAAANNLVGAFLVVSGVLYEITAVSWNTSAIGAEFTLKGLPDLSSIVNAVVPVITGKYYEISLLPKFSGAVNLSKVQNFLFPSYLNGVFQRIFYVPMDVGRDYTIEGRAIQNGNRSKAISIASYTPTYAQGTSTASNFTLNAAEFGITVNIANTGDWANADSFEVCWNVGDSASFDIVSHRKAITYATTMDIPLSDSLHVTVGVRPLRNGIIIAPAVYSSITSGSGGSLPNEKSFHVDVTLLVTDTTQSSRTVLQKAFRNPVEILQATFLSNGVSLDVSKFRVFQSNAVANIVAGQFTDDSSLNIQYSSQLALKIDEQTNLYEITADFFDDAVGASNANAMSGRLEIFYRDRTTQKQTVKSIGIPTTSGNVF